MSELWFENLCSGILLAGGEGGEAGRDDEGEHDNPPEIKPPLPNEVPAPQPSEPEIAPFQPDPPADPGMPQPMS